MVNQTLISRRFQIESKRKFFGLKMSLLYDLGSIFIKWEIINVSFMASLKIYTSSLRSESLSLNIEYIFVCPSVCLIFPPTNYPGECV